MSAVDNFDDDFFHSEENEDLENQTNKDSDNIDKNEQIDSESYVVDEEDDGDEEIQDENSENEVEKVLGDDKPLSKEKIEAFNKKIERTGLVYLSSVPPFMCPEKVKFLMGKYGQINRIYLEPEDSSLQRRRTKNGGSKKIRYTEGWVEFENKKEAKLAVAMMNGEVVGGKKSGFFHDCVWNMKYLRGFKWHHLNEKKAYEKRIRSDKLKAEFSQSRKDDDAYLENAHKSAIAKKVREKREKKEKEVEKEPKE